VNDDFQAKADTGRRLLDTLAGLRLTVTLLLLSILLVFLGTLEQVHWGVWHIQKAYFGSWICFYPLDDTAVARLPLPGGFLLGALLILNLTLAHLRHFKSGVRHLGMAMIHGGLLLLLGGGFVTALYQEESAMIIPEGESRDYSEAFREFELVLIEKTKAGTDKVTSVPDALLANGAAFPAAGGLTLRTDTYHRNATLRAQSQLPDGQAIEVTKGLGATSKLAFKPQKESFDDNNPNAPLALVTVLADGVELGRWVVSAALTESFGAQGFEHGGRAYEVALRRARVYHPFAVKLNAFTHEKYPGTNTPKRFASDVTVVADGVTLRNFVISMNQPLRHAGATLFQSSFGNSREGKDITVLQVVRNPGAWIPYASVLIMSVGLIWQFGFSLARFIAGRGRSAATAAAFLLAALPAQAAEPGWDSRVFGEIPVQAGGRIQPIETLASGSLLQMRARRELALSATERIAFGQKPSTWTEAQRAEIFRTLPGLKDNPAVLGALETRPLPLKGGALGSVDWLIEVAFRAHVARHLPTFRVDNPVVLKLAGRDPEQTKFVSWDDVLKHSKAISEAADKARNRPQADRDAEDRAIIQLETAARQYAALSMAFIPGDLPPDIEPQQEYRAWFLTINRVLAEMAKNRDTQTGAAPAIDQELQQTVRSLVDRYQNFAREGAIRLVPPKEAGSLDEWDNLGSALLGTIQRDAARRDALGPEGVVTRYANFCSAWRKGDDDACAREATALRASLAGAWSRHVEAEAGFGRLQAFYLLLQAYFAALLAVLAYWVTGKEGLRRWTGAGLLLLFVLHTAALLYRMWLHGRPPVTNLYSSGIFVAWGGVALGLILERFWKNGIGAAAAGLCGFLSLLVAHNLGLSGEDNLESVRAVLDSNFWLATHVTIVTLGYSATFVAGILGGIHLLLRAVKADYAAGDSVSRAAYGILAFATLASFVGTMLGGIWADQSWGRFWGWDPKENGAVLIVLWCAVCLHARWGGLVRREGLMQLLVFGNIVTAWSWFGTNLLGVGLHSYGFTESGFFWLYLVFMPSQLAILALGWLPARQRPTPASA
jgi:ABC-type transport system involved in cytochrome c biogenesis permease subunit